MGVSIALYCFTGMFLGIIALIADRPLVPEMKITLKRRIQRLFGFFLITMFWPFGILFILLY